MKKTNTKKRYTWGNGHVLYSDRSLLSEICLLLILKFVYKNSTIQNLRRSWLKLAGRNFGYRNVFASTNHRAIIEQEILSSDSEMSTILRSSTDTEDKDNMEDEESDEVLLSDVTPYQDEPLTEAD